MPTSADKIKILTREEIVTAGKARGTITDEATRAALPLEDPRRNISDDD